MKISPYIFRKLIFSSSQAYEDENIFANTGWFLQALITFVNGQLIGVSFILKIVCKSLESFEDITGLTPQEQSSEPNLPGTIVPWRDIFDNDVMIPKQKFRFQKILTA